MTLGDALFVGAFIILPLAIVIWCLTTLRSLRRRRKRAMQAAAYLPNLTEGTAEMPIVAAAGDSALDAGDAGLGTEQFAPPRRDWAAAIRPTRAQPSLISTTAFAPVVAAARPFHPPAYRGRSAGVVSRMTPPAARWPAAHRRVGKDVTRKDVMRKDVMT